MRSSMSRFYDNLRIYGIVTYTDMNPFNVRHPDDNVQPYGFQFQLDMISDHHQPPHHVLVPGARINVDEWYCGLFNINSPEIAVIIDDVEGGMATVFASTLVQLSEQTTTLRTMR